MNCKVSVIIPAKNEEEMIGDCLSALRNIDFPPDAYEIILVDNGSEDTTVDIAKSHGSKVFSLPGVTISALRNYGAAKATGEILAFIDADEVVARDWLKNALSAFDDPKIACVGSTPGIPDGATWVEKAWYMQIETRASRAMRSWLASMNMIVRENIFKEMGGFNERLLTCEDVDFGYRLSERYKILEDKSIAAVHLGEAKTLLQFFRKEMWRGKSNFAGVREHGLIFQEIPSLLIPLFYFGIMVFVPLAIIFGKTNLMVIGLLASGIFPFLRAIIISYRLKRFYSLPALFAVWWVYGFARAFSILLEIKSQFWNLSVKTPDKNVSDKESRQEQKK